MAQPRDLEELRALVRRLEVGLEGLPEESLLAAHFPRERYAAMRDALLLADELVGLRRSLDNYVVTLVWWSVAYQWLWRIDVRIRQIYTPPPPGPMG